MRGVGVSEFVIRARVYRNDVHYLAFDSTECLACGGTLFQPTKGEVKILLQGKHEDRGRSSAIHIGVVCMDKHTNTVIHTFS